MTKINRTNKELEQVNKKYCRIILTDDLPSWHRLVETKGGQLEYRMGIGKKKEMTVRAYRTLIRSIVQTAKSHQLDNIALEINVKGSPQLENMGTEWTHRTVSENLQLAQYEFNKYKTEEKDKVELKEILVCGKMTASEKKAFEAGLIIGEGANFTRDISNTSGDDMTPSLLAKAAQTALKGTKAKVTVLDIKAIKKLKMGLLEAVGKGASDSSRFIIVEYWGLGKPNKSDVEKKPVVLIGKGITYDSGGLNVKPSGSMHDMHMDMSGGGAVIGTMRAIAKLGLKKNVVGLIPTAENAISAESMRAGDIATSMSGLTVEIMHTDAEGRMVLADAITYAQKFYSPSVMLDAATLTGASLSALGQHTSAILTKDENLQRILQELGEESGDLMWPLPLWDEYNEILKSTRADICNIAHNFSRWGGCIEGGAFLSFFADKKIPWAHLDIAPRMESIATDKLAKGATGEPVRLLVSFVQQWKG